MPTNAIEWFEPLGCLEEQRRGVGPASEVQGDLPTKPLQHCTVELIQWSGRRAR